MDKKKCGFPLQSTSICRQEQDATKLYTKGRLQRKNRKKSGLLPNQVGVVSEGSKNPTPILESKMAKKDIKLVKKTR